MNKKVSHVKKSNEGTMNAIFYPGDFRDNWIPNILKEIYIEYSHKEFFTGVYDEFFIGKKDLVVIDLGAHIGLFTMYAREFAKRVYAVEPSAENYAYLVKNVDHNHWDNVTTFNVAISNKNGMVDLFQNENKTAHSLLGSPNQAKETVMCWTLEKFLTEIKEQRVDILKIDIEGAEFDVLSDVNLKENLAPVQCIYGEMHAWAQKNPNQLKWSLMDAGFEFKFIQREALLFKAWRNK